MLAFTRQQVLHNVKGMSQADLDYLLDAKANTIGALLYHLAATDHYYGLNTFGGMKWDSWPDEEKKKWDIPMNLDEPARKAIKGNNLDFYLNILHETREKTLAELKKRDDKWLTIVDKEIRRQQLRQVVPRSRTRIQPRRPNQIPKEPPPRRQTRRRIVVHQPVAAVSETAGFRVSAVRKRLRQSTIGFAAFLCVLCVPIFVPSVSKDPASAFALFDLYFITSLLLCFSSCSPALKNSTPNPNSTT